MQRYDREREARSFRGGRDYASRGEYRNDERWQMQGPPRAWRNEDGPGRNYADQGRDAHAGYDDEAYRADFIPPRYGRGQDLGFGYDDDDERRGNYATPGEQNHPGGQYGTAHEGGRPFYSGYARGGRYRTPARLYTGPHPDAPRYAGPEFMTDNVSASYGRDEPYHHGWRDDDGGQGYGYGGGNDMSPSASLRGRGPKNYLRSDERIREDLCERLTDDPFIDAGDITIEVKNGVVTLTGSVEARHLKHRVEDLADHCSGVKDIDNKLVLRKTAAGQNPAGSSGSSNRSDESSKKH